jgi:CDP-glucose 4,6-dehydratase
LTGHTGFKGAWLTLWLTSLGAEVRGYALAPESTPNIYAALALDGMCESSIADIRDDERLTHVLRDFRPDIAIHMAAQSLVRRSYVIPAETFAVNVQGTVNFFDACRHADSLRASIV